jgi:hypothetical protein
VSAGYPARGSRPCDDGSFHQLCTGTAGRDPRDDG